jgi:hypothetical protein
MKVEKIKAYVEAIEKMFGDEEITEIEMNEFVVKVGVAWGVFVNKLKEADRPECYGKLDKQNNHLVLSFRCDDGFVLVTKISV